MTLEEAIEARHSVRAYKEQPLAENVVKVLEEKIAVLNREGKLHIQLIQNEPKAFLGTMAKYGKFRNVGNYIVMAGQKAAIKREKSQACLDSSEREQARTKFKADDLDELAANGGDAQAQFATGWFLMTGTGVPVDEKKGLKWIHKATFQGYQPAIDYCKEHGYKWF